MMTVVGRGLVVAGLGAAALLVGAAPAEAGTSMTGVTSMDAAHTETCAVLADTTARCWGSGPLGDGQGFGSESATPVTVLAAEATPLTGIEQISVGVDHVCVLLVDTTAKCWGENLAGSVGDGTATPQDYPVTVEASVGVPLDGIAELASGDYFTCARLTNGQARCWGQNSGALGDGTNTNRRHPVAVRAVSGAGNLTNVAQIVAGTVHACARLTNGQARCWGGTGAPLGDGATQTRRRPVAVVAVSGPGPLTNIAQLGAGGQNVCARLTNGQVRCWGRNDQGQLGNGTVTQSFQQGPLRPVAVRAVSGAGNLTNVSNLVLGYFHACVRLTNGQARCWGGNVDGAVGDGTRPDPHARPRAVRNVGNTANLAGVVDLAAGDGHSCARLTDTSAVCWGRNAEGELGTGSTTPVRRLTPVVVLGA